MGCLVEIAKTVFEELLLFRIKKLELHLLVIVHGPKDALIAVGATEIEAGTLQGPV